MVIRSDDHPIGWPSNWKALRSNHYTASLLPPTYKYHMSHQYSCDVTALIRPARFWPIFSRFLTTLVSYQLKSCTSIIYTHFSVIFIIKS
ncbi:hypothetical protein HanRHA438_Chr13g0613491 [Helianthus annuus]|nr:hypothetical protein HanRHA438_Chr13g0613491 [Helianthus annuus]